MSLQDYPRRSQRIGPLDSRYFDEYADYVAAVAAKEREAFRVFRNFIEANQNILSWVAHIGDGECGELLRIMQEVLQPPPEEQPKRYRKKKIGAALRTAVFERDKYRCKRCGDHRQLSADHIHPEVLGGTTTLENLQTLCKSCNSSKGARVQECAE